MIKGKEISFALVDCQSGSGTGTAADSYPYMSNITAPFRQIKTDSRMNEKTFATSNLNSEYFTKAGEWSNLNSGRRNLLSDK